MTQGQRDGKNPKFRILCKSCNSYLHTNATIIYVGRKPFIRFGCSQCSLYADHDEEE